MTIQIYFRFALQPENPVIFRHLQLVANLCNDVLQSRIVPATIAGAVIVFGVSLAIVVNLISKQGNVYILLLMAIICVETVFYLIFGLRGLAEVYDLSKRSLQIVRIHIITVRGRLRRRGTRQFVKSCWVIRMKFAGNNFVEMLTPLNCIIHATQIAVQIPLLGKN